MKSVPLLLLHGWPGSVYEFYDSIPLLQSKAEKSGFSFDIIIPSMPGYGWSEPSYRVGKVFISYTGWEHTWIDFSNLIQWSNLLNHISAKFYVSNLLSLKV